MWGVPRPVACGGRRPVPFPFWHAYFHQIGSKSLAPPVLPSPNSLADVSVAADEEMDRFTVDEGGVKIVFPFGMTADSVDELEQFLALLYVAYPGRIGGAKC